MQKNDFWTNGKTFQKSQGRNKANEKRVNVKKKCAESIDNLGRPLDSTERLCEIMNCTLHAMYINYCNGRSYLGIVSYGQGMMREMTQFYRETTQPHLNRPRSDVSSSL